MNFRWKMKKNDQSSMSFLYLKEDFWKEMRSSATHHSLHVHGDFPTDTDLWGIDVVKGGKHGVVFRPGVYESHLVDTSGGSKGLA